MLPFARLVGHSSGSTTSSTTLWSQAATLFFQDTYSHITSNDYNPNAKLNSAFYMLHMAYDTAVPGGQSNTTDPTNCIFTLAGLPL
jgi:hypothetical protein